MLEDDVQQKFPRLPKLVDAWQEGGLSSDGHQLAELSELLLNHREARSYFLQTMQIDGELRWRMASSRKVEGALSTGPEGTLRPLASIMLNEMPFRIDHAFATVYGKVDHSDEHAQLWLRLYPAIRACALICISSLSDTDLVVNAICRTLSIHIEASTSPSEFQRIASDTALEQLARYLQDCGRSHAKVLQSIVRRCLDSASELDTIAIYESAEAIVPHQLSVDALRLLCNRYLIEQTPAEMAHGLGTSQQKVYERLAEARSPIWKACAAAAKLPVTSHHQKTLASLNRFLDAFSSSSNSDSGLRLLDNVLSWLKGGVQNCRSFLMFAILHESLYRQLSLPQLLVESQVRKDEAFHRVVTDMVTQMEDVPAAPAPEPVPAPRPRARSTAAGWYGAIAAALLISATLAIWGASRPSSPPPSGAIVSQSATKQSEEAPEPGPAPAPPQPIVVGTVHSILDLPEGAALGDVGAPVVAGQTIEFTEGIVQITTVSGSQWVLQGPILLVMEEGGAVSLQRGRLVGLNSGQAIPLVVHTPTTTVVDVGTEFGVGVSDELETSVAVYQGAVTLGEAAEDGGVSAESAIAIEANSQAVVAGDGVLRVPPEPLVHDRDFIRPDEVQLRHEMQQGSTTAAERVAFFEMLRVEGLLAYQSFHAASNGEAFTIGFAAPGMRPVGTGEFGPNVQESEARFSSSRSLVLSNGNSVFLDLDASEHSPLTKSGLLDEEGMLGHQAGEIWLSWRSKSDLKMNKQFAWVGLSIMHGDRRTSDEPLFVGKPSDMQTFGIHLYGADNVKQELDVVPGRPGVQPLASDSNPHHWIVRVACAGGGNATASVWCDIDPAQAESIPPHAEHHYDDLRFDRIRVEVSEGGDPGSCAFDQVILTTSNEALTAALSVAASR